MKARLDIFAGLPRGLRIGPLDVGVSFREFDDGETWGDFHFGSLSIRLATSQPGLSFAADTLLHEINHAIFKIYVLERGDSEERIASVMATAWTQVLRSNPKLISWLAKVLKN